MKTNKEEKQLINRVSSETGFSQKEIRRAINKMKVLKVSPGMFEKILTVVSNKARAENESFKYGFDVVIYGYVISGNEFLEDSEKNTRGASAAYMGTTPGQFGILENAFRELGREIIKSIKRAVKKWK